MKKHSLNGVQAWPVVLTVLVAAGCTNSATNEEGEVHTKADTPAPAEKAVADGALSRRQQITMAVDDLADKLEIDRTEVQTLRGGEVQWPSSALGCPEPGKSYLDVQTPGSWFLLEARNQVYYYHAADGRKPFLCPEGRRQPLPSIGRLD